LHDVGAFADSEAEYGEDQMKPRYFLLAMMAAAILTETAGTAAGEQRYPVMGCNARGADPKGAAEAYAPAQCALSSAGPGGLGYGSASTLYSFSRVRWSHWGAKTATGHGVQVYCSNGCWTSKITVTAFGLRRNVNGLPVSAYSRLRLVEPRQVVYVIGRTSHPMRDLEPGYTAVYNVMPIVTHPTSTPSPGASAPGHPPCTIQALAAGLKRGADPQPTGTIPATLPRGRFGFDCAGGFAYSGGELGGNDVIFLFIASGGRWETADRDKYCLSHQLPASIYTGACTTD
jgi:hypothetical protein